MHLPVIVLPHILGFFIAELVITFEQLPMEGLRFLGRFEIPCQFPLLVEDDPL